MIAETTMEMSNNVKDYLNRIEKKKSRSVRSFSAMPPHELKTPITSIQGYAELMESGMIQDEAMKLDFIRRIKKEASNMAGADRGYSDDFPGWRQRMPRWCFPMCGLALFGGDRRKLKARSRPEPGLYPYRLPAAVHKGQCAADEGASTNLVGNAVKYNHPGGQVWVTIREQDGQMVIRVRDNGVGIPEESLDRILNVFTGWIRDAAGNRGGTGLGLSIVKHIVNFITVLSMWLLSWKRNGIYGYNSIEMGIIRLYF